MKKLEGKVALITGASRGIGKGIAEAFAEEGADLVLVARNLAELTHNAAQLAHKGVTAIPVQADVTDEKQVHDAFEFVQARFGRLDLLVNNAGKGDHAPLDEMTVETWDRSIALNLRGPFLCTRQAFRMMKNTRSGRIINIGSIAGRRARIHTAPYAASKAGVWALTEVTALEGREFGITCGCVFPGNVLVERLRDRKEPMMPISSVAQTVLLMASLPPDVSLLEAVVLPRDQPYVGRG